VKINVAVAKVITASGLAAAILHFVCKGYSPVNQYNPYAYKHANIYYSLTAILMRTIEVTLCTVSGLSAAILGKVTKILLRSMCSQLFVGTECICYKATRLGAESKTRKVRFGLRLKISKVTLLVSRFRGRHIEFRVDIEEIT